LDITEVESLATLAERNKDNGYHQTASNAMRQAEIISQAALKQAVVKPNLTQYRLLEQP
jgi:hypothetical protein